MLDKKNLDVLKQLEAQMKEAEQNRKELEEKAQKQVGATVKLNLKQYRTKNGDVLRDTIDGITYEINPFYNDCAGSGDCFVQVEKVRQDIVLDCKPAPPMKIFEIEDALIEIRRKADTTDMSRLARAREKINGLLNTLQYYDQRKQVFGKDYEEKVPQYIEKFRELAEVIDRKIERFGKFDKPIELKFKLIGKECKVVYDNETVAQFTVAIENNAIVIGREDIIAEGYDKSKFMHQLFGQVTEYLKNGYGVSEVYVTAEPGSLKASTLKKIGFIEYPGKRLRNEIVFYKPLIRI